MTADAPHRYRAHGLRIASAIRLLPGAADEGAGNRAGTGDDADLRVERARLAHRPLRQLEVDGRDWWFGFGGIATYALPLTKPPRPPLRGGFSLFYST